MSRLPTILRYRGREGMLAWAFHRISGIGIFAFVVLHVVDIYLVGGNPELYDEVLASTRACPGGCWRSCSARRCCTTRSTACGSSSSTSGRAMTVYHRQLWWISWTLFILVGVPGALIIMRPVWLPLLQQLGLA